MFLGAAVQPVAEALGDVAAAAVPGEPSHAAASRWDQSQGLRSGSCSVSLAAVGRYLTEADCARRVLLTFFFRALGEALVSGRSLVQLGELVDLLETGSPCIRILSFRRGVVGRGVPRSTKRSAV